MQPYRFIFEICVQLLILPNYLPRPLMTRLGQKNWTIKGKNHQTISILSLRYFLLCMSASELLLIGFPYLSLLRSRPESSLYSILRCKTFWKIRPIYCGATVCLLLYERHAACYLWKLFSSRLPNFQNQYFLSAKC